MQTPPPRHGTRPPPFHMGRPAHHERKADRHSYERYKRRLQRCYPLISFAELGGEAAPILPADGALTDSGAKRRIPYARLPIPTIKTLLSLPDRAPCTQIQAENLTQWGPSGGRLV